MKHKPTIFRIGDIQDDIIKDISHYNFSLEGKLLVDNEAMYRMLSDYANRKMLMSINMCEYEYFKRMWDLYINTNTPNWSKIIKAYEMEYNPISNYDMTETENTHHNGNNEILIESSINNSSNSTGNTNSFNTKPSTVNSYVTSDENPSGRLSGYTTSDSDVTGTTSMENSSNTTANNSRTESYADVKRDLSRSGNIGVTTSQQMLQSEIDLRKLNITNRIIRGFINENTYYSEDVENEFNNLYFFW